MHISHETGEQVCFIEKLKVTTALGCGGFPLKKNSEGPAILKSTLIMSNSVEAGLAKSTGVIGIAAGVFGLGNCICGFIWLDYNGYGGHGLWSGFGVS